MSELTWPVVIAFSVAVVSTYMLVRRVFFSEHEAREAADYLNKPLGWETRESDLIFTRQYMRSTVPWYALGAAFGWAWVGYCLLQR